MKHIRKKEKPLIVLTAGGTGGHVYPAEALAEELLKRGYRLALITDSRGKNNYKGKLSEILNYAVWTGAVVGKSKWFKIKSLFKTAIGVLQAGYFMLKYRPVCVVGFGGYASFPAAMAAILLGRDLIIHEQNSVMSRTNRFLAKYAEVIALSFPNTKYAPQNKNTKVCGMPIRKVIADLLKAKYPERTAAQKFQLMILGGSQGAKVFGDVMPQAIALLPEVVQKKLRIYQQCRDCDVKKLAEAYQASKADVVVQHFFENMNDLYAGTHMIISRAGASSVTEIAVAGVPSVLVPLPTAADDHQTHNAAELGKSGAAVIIKQKDFTAEKVAEVIAGFVKAPKDLQKMSDKARKCAINDAAKRLADVLEKEVIKHW